MLRSSIARVLRPSFSCSSSLSHSFRVTPIIASATIFKRTFATRTPPGVYGLSGKTATSVFNAAKEANSIPEISDNLNNFLSAYESSPNLRAALVNPLYKGEKRDQLISGIFEKLEIKSTVSQNLIKWIIDGRHTGKLKKIVADFEKLAAFDRKEITATVTTAEPLTNDQVNRLTTALKSRIEADEKLVLIQKVDPQLLGGLKVMIDNKLLDLTVANRIKQIDRALRAGAKQDQEA